MTCFAAGMLLTISIVHIMPEANALYADYLKESEEHDNHRLLEENDHNDHQDKEEGHGSEFPLPYVIFLLGFMLMLILD